ncbi:hypothetical protein C7C56_026245 [Massilia glaciei]|uniref:Uncharacterized protein n=2 Tax=Massilia glaciei TaxID=1524097 RepID=A0A2U2HC21_9BURK|nr:hypothetical protein C7C56_026245 [Massilia glaciei]
MLQSLLRFVVRHVLMFVLVVLVLLAGGWALAQWSAHRAGAAGLATLERGDAELGAHRARLGAELGARMAAMQKASLGTIDARIVAVSALIGARAGAPGAPLLVFPLPAGGALAQAALGHARGALELALLRQERDYLVALRAAVSAGLDLDGARAQLARLHAAHVAAYAAVVDNVHGQRRLRRDHPLASWLPGTPEYGRFSALKDQYLVLRAANGRAAEAYLAHKALLGRMLALSAPGRFAIAEPAVDAALLPLRAGIADGRRAVRENWVARAAGPVREVAPAAAVLVLLIILTPVAVKALFYFVLAPLAARRPPIILDPGASGACEPPAGARSRVAQSLTIGSGEQLLIHSDYIQSSSIRGEKATQWLLSWSCPFTSIAAGLVALTRVRTGATESIVVSASDDPFSEVVLLTLPKGAAMVFQPRALVGVVVADDAPLVIDRCWRLGSLHAWLSLQLRYLVFRGPVTLVVRGCRGVRSEAAGGGRRISQFATLGFSANLAYSTMRCETFFPYLRGRESLFHDRFEGGPGQFIYEETPRAGVGGGAARRGLEGVADALLKVFGI